MVTILPVPANTVTLPECPRAACGVLGGHACVGSFDRCGVCSFTAGLYQLRVRLNASHTCARLPGPDMFSLWSFDVPDEWPCTLSVLCGLQPAGLWDP